VAFEVLGVYLEADVVVLDRFPHGRGAEYGGFEVGLRAAEMAEPSEREAAAAHKTVRRGPRPTRLDGQTSHPVTKTDRRAHDIRPAKRKAVRLDSFDGDGVADAVGDGRVLDQSLEEPIDAGLPDQVVGSLKVEVLGDVPAARCGGVFAGFRQHS